MLSNVIYKRDVTGNIRTWQGEAVGGAWRSHTGVIGGNLVTSAWAESPARSQINSEKQAVFEMEAQLTKLLAKDYRASIALVDVPRGSFIKPMLAAKYDKATTASGFSQPKLDGMRCLANVDGLWSRGAKPINAAPHVLKALETVQQRFPYVVLDGELYNHDYHDDFNKLMSVARKQSPTGDELAESEKIIQYWVYDCFIVDKPDVIFSDRFELLRSLFLGYDATYPIQLVPTHPCYTSLQFQEQHMEYVQNGFEGSMFRLNYKYEQKRSKALQKNKDFITEEFKLLGYEEGKGNWSGYAKRALCETNEGVEFGAGIKGNQEFCKELLATDPKVFESVTIRHFGKTPDGSIRFPIAISFNETNSLERRPPTGENNKSSLNADSTEDIF